MKSLRFIVITLLLVFGLVLVSYAADETGASDEADMPNLTGIWEVGTKTAGYMDANATFTCLIVQKGDSFSIRGPLGALEGVIRNGKYNIYGPLPRFTMNKVWLQIDKIILTPVDKNHFTGFLPISIFATKDAAGKMMSTDANWEATRVIDPPPLLQILGQPEVWVKTGAEYKDAGALAFNETGSDVSEKIVAKNSVDINTPGEYSVTYNITGDNNKAAPELARKVHVVNPAPPAIKLRGDEQMTVKKGAGFLDPGFTALNYLMEDVGKTVQTTVNGKEMDPNLIDTSEPGEIFEIVYTLADDNGTVTAKRTVTIQGLEDEKPIWEYWCFISGLVH